MRAGVCGRGCVKVCGSPYDAVVLYVDVEVIVKDDGVLVREPQLEPVFVLKLIRLQVPEHSCRGQVVGQPGCGRGVAH